MSLALNFDASQVPAAQPFVPLEAGWYTAKLVESEQKPTKDNATSGSWYVALQFEIIGGKYNGRRIFTNLNLKNANPEAERIAYEQLSAICHATGRIKINDVSELHGIPLELKVNVKVDPTGEYEPRNEVKGYRPSEGGAPGASAPSAPAKPKAASAPAAAAPKAPTTTKPPAAPVVAPRFPPAGWAVHPDNSEYYFKDSEVLSEAELRSKYATPTAPPAPPSAPAVAATPAGVPASSAADPADEAPSGKAPWET